MSQVSISLASFLGIFFETLLVGVFIPLLFIAGYAQWTKVLKGRKVNAVMAFTTVFFGLSITIHWILGARRAILGALYRPPGVAIDLYFLPPYSTEEIVRSAIFQFQIVIGDLIMVYRMYHIYDKSLLACAIPSVVVAGLFAIGCGFTNEIRGLESPAYSKPYVDWATGCFCLTLFNSAFMSACISFRLWKVHRETTLSGVATKNSIIPLAMRVLVGSAALWTLAVSMNFFAFLAQSNLAYTFLDMTSPVVGISFCLIIVRLGSVSPEVRNDSWESSQRTRMLSVSDSRLSRLPVTLDRVKVERDVYVNETESGVMEFRMMSPSTHREKQSSS